MHPQVFDWDLVRLTQDSDRDFLCDVAKQKGIDKRTREGWARLDRKRKNKVSSAEPVRSTKVDTRIAKMKGTGARTWP